VSRVALVGVQTGLDQTLLKRTPEFISACKCGILGLLLPIEYPGVASKPISSEMISKILGWLVLSTGPEELFVLEPPKLLEVSFLLQPLIIKTVNSQSNLLNLI
jgi:hypothetical protein